LTLYIVVKIIGWTFINIPGNNNRTGSRLIGIKVNYRITVAYLRYQAYVAECIIGNGHSAGTIAGLINYAEAFYVTSGVTRNCIGCVEAAYRKTLASDRITNRSDYRELMRNY
jgi:hypothetical protein